ncbi:E3 ubiquitin-protein ligase TRIM56-like [Lineus longissimus]|uniref:E3 ubiquitin-protein ligase TRIM56-like n=1 Tax=Lineus longissimus TaxID=88925 RepID=UPI00315C4C1F
MSHPSKYKGHFCYQWQGKSSKAIVVVADEALNISKEALELAKQSVQKPREVSNQDEQLKQKASIASEISVLSLQEEIECSICLKPYEIPKIVGECQHTFCLECIRSHIKQQDTADKFVCPLCRKPCPIPSSGADGLKTDFKMASIVDKVKAHGSSDRMSQSVIQIPKAAAPDPMTASLPAGELPAPTIAAPPCGACGKSAFNFCERCHGANLCGDCSASHSVTPFTKDHELIELCGLHGKPIECFCFDCDRVACCICLMAIHPVNSHKVTSFRDVFKAAQMGVTTGLDQCSIMRRRVQANEKAMGVFYCQVLRKQEKEKLERDEAADESTRKIKWELGDVRAEIESIRRRLDILLQQEKDLVRAKDHFETENAKSIEEKEKNWKAVIGDMRSSITSLGDSIRGLKGVMEHGQEKRKIRDLSGDNLALLKQAVSGMQTRFSDADQAANAAEKIRFSLKTKIGIYTFHHLHTNSVALRQEDTIAERWEWGKGWSMVFTDRPLDDGKVVEVTITGYDESKPDWGSAYGISTVPPDQLLEVSQLSGKCSYNGSWDFDGSWTICQNAIRRGNRQLGKYNFNTLQLRKGTKLGIVRRADGSVNFVVDGIDYGAAFHDIPAGSYGYFCLDGRVTELTMT